MPQTLSLGTIAGIGICVTACISGMISFVFKSNQERCKCELANAIGSEDYSATTHMLHQNASPDVDVFRYSPDVGCSGQAIGLVFTPATRRRPALNYTLFPQTARDVGNTKMARILLEAGANPNLVDENGDTSLHIASNYGNAEAVRLLLMRGANRAATNSKGQTALDLARLKSHTTIIALLTSTSH